MNYEEFKAALIAELPAYLPAKYRDWKISLHEVVKVNGVYEALCVMSEDSTGGTPNLYLEELFAYYQGCKSISKVCQKAAAVFVNGMEYISRLTICSMADIPKEQIIFVLIPQMGNERLLAGVPHRLTLDLAVVYRVVLMAGEGGINSAIINHDMAEEMKLTEEELYRLALDNTPKLMPVDLRKSESVFFTLTNILHISGASTMLYPGVLANLAEELKQNLFILPSSIHEVFIIPDVGQDVKAMNRIIASANENVLEKDEILADHAYYYNRKTDQVCIPKK